MRVTNNSTYRLMQTNLERITTKLQNLQNQGSTGLRLNKPSDDPAAIGPMLTASTELSHNNRYLQTMGTSQDKMKTTDGYLNDVETNLQKAKELAINAVNGSLSPKDLNTIADQIDEIKKQLLDSANAQVDGKYIFAGYKENTKPFVENASYDPSTYDPTDTTTWPVLYQGDANPTQLEISPGEYEQVNLTGNELFLGVSDANWVDSTTAALNQPESGKVDVFGVLTRTEEAIRAGNVDNTSGAGGGIENNIADLETAADQNRLLRAQLGVRAARVDSAMQHQQSSQVDLKQIISRYQDADAISTFNDLVKQQTAYQAALDITSKVSSVSILDYL